MQLILEQNGAGLNILISGNPDEVAREVNRLYNYGVISDVDETYREGIDETIFVQSDPGRFNKGMEAMAMAEIFPDAQLKKALKGIVGGFMPEVRALAQEIKKRFVRGTMPRALRCLPDWYVEAASLD